LRGADLRGADLREANLRGADLHEANLYGADLREADLPAPTIVLLASWGSLSDDLTLELMRYDASCYPSPAAFDLWATGSGPCPYENCKVTRAALFTEKRELWSPGPSLRPYDLMVRVLKEKCKWEDEGLK
jgi:hypothetical protein